VAGHAAHATGDAMSAYPVAYHQTAAIERSRLTVFFRFIMVIPHLIWSFVYGLATGIAVFIAWFATVFTGRYPDQSTSSSPGTCASRRVCTRTRTSSPTSSPRSTAANIPSIPLQRASRRVKRATTG